MAGKATVEGGVTAPAGFTAAGVCAGIKQADRDLALLVSDRPSAVAGVFTTNRIQAAPVKLCRERLAGRVARAVVVNSGNANACTGPEGLADAREMGRVAAEAVGVDEDTVFPCSTGTIGVPLPMEKVRAGIEAAAAALSPSGGDEAALAIMTTDTVSKQTAVVLTLGGVKVHIGGMAKGAGMIEPNMATMLAFLTTDACVPARALQQCLSEAVGASFNRISVDGDQSTNDTVLFLANGASGGAPLDEAHPEWHSFVEAVRSVCRELACALVKDGEGATRFVTVCVKGARSGGDAELAARAVSGSLLVKTSWYGGDPNWGRIMGAVGYSGAVVVDEKVEICYDGLCAVSEGRVNRAMALSDLENVLRQKTFSVTVDLHLGEGAATVYTCDCSVDYVRINADYTT